MENGFSSPRNDMFPAGLRVLVVDDDPTWLKILEKMLKKCSYEVTTCGLARDALKLLRERKDGFDIVISDVYMTDMDGFKLLELVGLEMDLPVIMMSVDGETSRVMKGVQHGACDYLLKPIRMKELRNIWQHVVRKKIQEVRDIEVLEGVQGAQMIRNASDHSEDGRLVCGEDSINVRKRKDVESKHNDKELGDTSSTTKKARVVWSVDLHQKFVKAVHQIGFDRVGPKKILDLMNVPWLTRENVASHLQKYRLYLSRLQKKNDLENSEAECSLKDAAGSFGIQNSINMQHCNVSKGKSLYFGSNLVGLDVDLGSQDRKPVRHPSINVPAPTEFCHSSTSAYDLTFSKCQSCYDGFCPLDHQLQNDYFQQTPAPAICYEPSLSERDIKPLYDDYRIDLNHRCSTEGALDSIFPQTRPHTASNQDVSFNFSSTSGMNNQSFNLNWFTNLESAANFDSSTLVSLDDGVLNCWIQGDCYGTNFGLQNAELSEYHDRLHLCDEVRYDYENLFEPSDYSVMF